MKQAALCPADADADISSRMWPAAAACSTAEGFAGHSAAALHVYSKLLGAADGLRRTCCR